MVTVNVGAIETDVVKTIRNFFEGTGRVEVVGDVNENGSENHSNEDFDKGLVDVKCGNNDHSDIDYELDVARHNLKDYLEKKKNIFQDDDNVDGTG